MASGKSSSLSALWNTSPLHPSKRLLSRIPEIRTFQSQQTLKEATLNAYEYEIACGQTTATVSEKGGTVTAFEVDGTQILYPWREHQGKARGGNPICAPWFGSSPRGEKKHGHLRNMETVGVLDKTLGSIFLRFLRKGDRNYPWSLNYETGVVVDKRELYVALRIERLDDGIGGRAPILPGFHPYFACQDAATVEVCVGGETYRGFSEQSREVPLTNEVVLIKMPDRTIEIRFGGAFSLRSSRLVLWTDAPDSYVCVEPVLEDKRLFDTPQGSTLDVGEQLDLSMSLKVL